MNCFAPTNQHRQNTQLLCAHYSGILHTGVFLSAVLFSHKTTHNPALHSELASVPSCLRLPVLLSLLGGGISLFPPFTGKSGELFRYPLTKQLSTLHPSHLQRPESTGSQLTPVPGILDQSPSIPAERRCSWCHRLWSFVCSYWPRRPCA